VRLQRFKGGTWDYSLAAWLAFETGQKGTLGAAPHDAELPQASTMQVEQ
jgi:hypothetical protein